MKLRLLTMTILAYGLLLAYASLMPFDIASGPGMAESCSRFWKTWPFDPDVRLSGSDALGNLALYVPLGWLIASRFRLGRKGAGFSLIAATSICSALSMLIELMQTATVNRTSSASDWMLNTVSGLAGALPGSFCGNAIWAGTIRWLQNRWRTGPLEIGTLVLMGLLSADAFAPYMPTISPGEVWQNVKMSHFNLRLGLEVHSWDWWLVQRGMVYAIMTGMLAGWGAGPAGMKRWVRAAAVAGLFALLVETGKLMITTRFFNLANVVVSLFGCLAALFLGSVTRKSFTLSRKLESAIAALLIYLFHLAWTPFNFVPDIGMISMATPTSPAQLLPFYHYAMGSELNHARLFIQSVLLLGTLVYLLRIRFGVFEGNTRGVILSAAVTMGALGFLLEGGQIFLPSRTPSFTDVYCFALGGGFGAWVRHPGKGVGAR